MKAIKEYEEIRDLNSFVASINLLGEEVQGDIWVKVADIKLIDGNLEVIGEKIICLKDYAIKYGSADSILISKRRGKRSFKAHQIKHIAYIDLEVK